MIENTVNFNNLTKIKSNIIKVIGVGGGGGNAINYMYNKGIKDVDFIICNTDIQALEESPIPNKVQLGSILTGGLGAGSIAAKGREAAVESIDDLKKLLDKQTKMVFITAGMGGGTGTGAAPVIAQTCKELGILTVGIVTTPFSFEGGIRKKQAIQGIKELENQVDTLLVISNDKLQHIYGNLTIRNAFAKADNILTIAAKGIAEIITIPGFVNVDFNDVNTVMKDSGVAIMGSAVGEGEHRALNAIEEALNSPLLNDNEITGAKHILLNITSGTKEVLMEEITDITQYIEQQAHVINEPNVNVIWGNSTNESLGDKISVTVIATGFKGKHKENIFVNEPEKPEITKFDLDNSNSIDFPVEQNIFNSNVAEKDFKTREVGGKQYKIFPLEKEDETNSDNSLEWDLRPQQNSNEKDEIKKYDLDYDSNSNIGEINQIEENHHQYTQKADFSHQETQVIREIKPQFQSVKLTYEEMEKEPAFMRRGIKLIDHNHSVRDSASQKQVVKNNNGDLKIENKFLHRKSD